MTHWATEYIGLPWEYGARGPRAYDCWNFVCVVMKNNFSIQMPNVEYEPNWKDAAYKLNTAENRKNWREVPKPVEGDITFMGRSRYPVHIGIWINANGSQGVLHCMDRIGVHFTTQNMLVASGWGLLEHYRHSSR